MLWLYILGSETHNFLHRVWEKHTQKQRVTQRKRWATEKEKFQLKKKKRKSEVFKIVLLWLLVIFVLEIFVLEKWNEMKERESLPWKGVGSELIKRYQDKAACLLDLIGLPWLRLLNLISSDFLKAKKLKWRVWLGRLVSNLGLSEIN